MRSRIKKLTIEFSDGKKATFSAALSESDVQIVKLGLKKWLHVVMMIRNPPRTKRKA